MILDHAIDQESFSCDNCENGFLCSQLNLSIQLGNTLIEQNKLPPKQRLRLAELLNQLKQQGWQYPFGKEACPLSKNRRKVIALTDELIEVINRGRHPLTQIRW